MKNDHSHYHQFLDIIYFLSKDVDLSSFTNRDEKKMVGRFTAFVREDIRTGNLEFMSDHNSGKGYGNLLHKNKMFGKANFRKVLRGECYAELVYIAITECGVDVDANSSARTTRQAARRVIERHNVAPGELCTTFVVNRRCSVCNFKFRSSAD